MTEREEMLETAPVGKLLFKLAVPTVIAQLINMLYNIVDRIYIHSSKPTMTCPPKTKTDMAEYYLAMSVFSVICICEPMSGSGKYKRPW